MYDSRQTYLVHFHPRSAAAPAFTCCQQSGATACPPQYEVCGGTWDVEVQSFAARGVDAAPPAHAEYGGAGTPTLTPITTPSPSPTTTTAAPLGGNNNNSPLSGGAAGAEATNTTVYVLVGLLVATAFVAGAVFAWKRSAAAGVAGATGSKGVGGDSASRASASAAWGEESVVGLDGSLGSSNPMQVARAASRKGGDMGSIVPVVV